MTKQDYKIIEIINSILRTFQITRDELVGKRRTRRLVRARHYTCYMLRKQTNLSYTEIGRIFNRHHSSIIHGVQKVGRELNEKNNATANDCSACTDCACSETRNEHQS